MYKIFYIVLGYILMLIGIAGFYLPLLPGVFFLILSAYCFMKSYPKYYNLIINNKLYGKYVKDFIEKKIIPKFVKIKIIIFIWVFGIISFIYLSSINIVFMIFSLLISIVSTIIIASTNNE